MPAEADRAPPHAALDAAHRFLISLKRPGPVLVALSGGSDSKGLLLALHDALTSGLYPSVSLCACTVDHALRPQSVDEAAAMKLLCDAHGIPHATMIWDGEKPKTGLQAAARLARYGLLSQAAMRMGALCVVTGHSGDDQAETIAMRTSRSHPQAFGLSGMAPAVLFRRKTWILRPFLKLGRMEIRDYLTAKGEGWIDDPSNSNSRFERARIRLAGAYSPAMPNASAARAASSRRVADFLKQYVTAYGHFAASIDPALTQAMDDTDARRAIFSLASVLGGLPHPVGRETATRVAAFLAGGADGRMTAGRVVFDRRRSMLYLYREARDLPAITLQRGEAAVWDGRFDVVNQDDGAVCLSAAHDDPETFVRASAGPIAAGLPVAIAKRSSRATWAARPADDRNSPVRVKVTARIALYDTFLPCFDSMIGDAIAVLLGRELYLSSPVHDVLT